MSAAAYVNPTMHYQPDEATQAILMRERRKSLMLRAWILAGLFFMTLPGTLLGFTNLLAISAGHSLAAMSAALIQGHGHAQVFGWVGSFILGIGFYSQPAKGRSVLPLPLTCFVLWTLGVALRWSGNIYGWHWKILLPVSAGLELVAMGLFLNAAMRHKLPETARPETAKPKVEMWMITVLVGTAGLAAAMIFNFAECVRLAAAGAGIAFPHALDSRFLVLIAWGFLVPFVWGFSARWLPSFLAIQRPNARLVQIALGLDVAGVLSGVAGWALMAAILLALGAVAMVAALKLTARPYAPAKVQGIHPSFTFFVRIPYAWLLIASGLGIWAAMADMHGGIWGASRHALTVGFVATMIFAIGPRILPHFMGLRALFSKRLMFLSLVLLQTGCTLRVLSEPLAYEGFLAFAWKTLPISGVIELSAVLVFALNMTLTVARGEPMSAQEAARS